MTKQELHALAAEGVRKRLAELERQLATYFAEWPELFLSKTAPQLLAAEPRASANGAWPTVTATKATTTPQGKAPKATSRDHSRRLDLPMHRRIREFLADSGPSRETDVGTGVGIDRKTNRIHSLLKTGARKGWVKRLKDGSWAVGPHDIPPDPE